MERATRAMIYGYKSLRDKGMSNAEIAEYFGVTPTTVRKYRKVIADVHGMNIDDLYDHTPTTGHGLGGGKALVDCDELLGELSAISETLDNVIRLIENILKED